MNSGNIDVDHRYRMLARLEKVLDKMDENSDDMLGDLIDYIENGGESGIDS